MARQNYWHQFKSPIFLPDIGTFFNRDIATAKDLVTQLAASGVKTIKGEILHDANICLKTDVTETYYGHVSQKKISENYRELIERKVVSLAQYRQVFNLAKSLGLNIVLSVYDFEGADFAKELDVMAIKIASSNITHQPLIEYIASLGTPMIFDTGHSTIEEASRAISWARDAGNFDVLVEHSPPGPPNDVSLHQLAFMNTLGIACNCPTGLSDHHCGDEMLYAAVALGATIIEKGVCQNNIHDEQDAGHALPIGQVKQTLLKINNIAAGLGNGYRELPRTRAKYVSRMGLIAKQDIKPGQSLTLENTGFAFPNIGIGTEYWSECQELKVVNKITAGQVIKWSDLRGKD